MNTKRLACGLVTIGALALLGTAASSAGAATALCNTNANPCPIGNLYAVGTAVKGASVIPHAKFKTSLGTIECRSSIGGKTSGSTSATSVPGEITSLAFSSCTLSFNPCTVTAVNLPYKASFTSFGVPNGSLKAESGGTGSPGATIVCGAIINCTVTRTVEEYSLLGGSPATISLNGASMTGSGGKCPALTTLTVEYELSQPIPLFLTE